MEPLVTMSDIARIASVTRQAVTNWRSRSASIPFPSPKSVVADVEHFDRDEVIDWLEATGRGLNASARLDAPAVAVPAGLAVEDAVALLAFRASVGQDLAPLGADERIALAREVDPDDTFLLDEVTRLSAADDLAAYVDGLHEASYGPSDALDRLYMTRAAQGGRGLTPAAVSLLQQLADVCRTFLGPDGVAVELRLDPQARSVATGFESASPNSERAALRLHAIDGRQVESIPGPLVKVISLAGLDERATLDAADDIAVDLDADQIAIVVGSASAPCDRLRGDLYDARKSNPSDGGGGTRVRPGRVELQGEDFLAEITRELVGVMRRDIKTDWTVRDDVHANRSSIKRLLVKYKYPPDKQPEAIKLVIEQMESMAPSFVASATNAPKGGL